MPVEPASRLDDVAIVRVLAEVLDGLSVAVCLFDGDLGTLHWNRTFLQFFPEHDGHIHVGEHYNRNLRRFYEARLDAEEMPEIDRYIDDGIARCLAQSLPYDFKHRGRWLRVSCLPVGTFGRIRMWTQINRPGDTSATLDLLATAPRSQAAEAIEDIADGMIVIAPDQRIRAANDRFLLLYRLSSRTDVIGKTYREVLAYCASETALPDAGALENALLALADNQRFSGAPFEVPLTGGRWMRVIEHRAVDGSVVSTHLDVTEVRRLQLQTVAANETLTQQIRERERAEMALREANRWLSLAEQIAHVGHWHFEIATRRLFWSDEIYCIYGRSKDSFVPSLGHPSLAYDTDGKEAIEALVAQVLASGEEFETRLAVKRPDGEVRHTLMRGTPQRDAAGVLTSFFGVMVDQTEQRMAEEKLRQAEKMQVIGGLAAGVAHDFNNILTAVIGNLSLVRKMLPATSPAAVYVSDALNEGQRGAELTHNLLGYARRQVLAPVHLDAGRLIVEQRGFLARALGAQIVVEADVAPAVSAVKVDRAQLQTALMNLAINAAHAMPRGGRLRMGVREFEVDAATRREDAGDLAPGRYVVLTVSDTGSGMPDEVREHAFDPFFTTKGVEGLGLGLPMVHGFTRQSGGDARIYSVLGEGTRVEIWLPAASSETVVSREMAPQAEIEAQGEMVFAREGTAEAARAPSEGDTRRSILVVDDQPAVLDVVAGILRRAGFAVLEAASGHAALEMVASADRLDGIVTDYTMPAISGVEVVQRARILRPGIPSLIITGFAEIDDFDPEAHDIAIMTKPFRSEALVGAVNQLLTRHSVQAE